ncbi:MAG: APC family permease [Polyangiaceae bacterium]|nr:APC family permease [Polyangiaceae bacterium]
MPAEPKKLGLLSGVGLVMADMVGTGVLTTAGFMASELSPRSILLDWLVGGLVALAGALAYASLARQVPRSGGEYRYLSSLVHPAAGYIAGWTSLLVGFSVPVALAALAAGAFGETLVPGWDGRFTAAILVALVTVAHAFDLRASKWTQNVLAAVKALLLVGFVLVGLRDGSNALPAWPSASADASGFPLRAFFGSLVFITFCYSGWNAATYASEDFENPRRDVPRAMLLGCLAVTVLYLLVNWVFVTNLSRADMASWIKGDTDRITLAHLVVRELLGVGAARLVSVLIIIALTSAISAMTLIGPRVYAAMAHDRFLPSWLAAREGRPPLGSVLLQSALATSLIFLSGFRDLLNNVGSILAVVSGATVLSLFRRRRWRAGERPAISALVGALVYASMAGWMVYFAVRASHTVQVAGFAVPTLALWMLAIVAMAMLGFYGTRVVRPDAGARQPRRASDRALEDGSERRRRPTTRPPPAPAGGEA